MVYSRTLARTLYVPWGDSYIHYNVMKPLVKRIGIINKDTDTEAALRESSLADAEEAFEIELERQMDKVGKFYMEKMEMLNTQLAEVERQINSVKALQGLLLEKGYYKYEPNEMNDEAYDHPPLDGFYGPFTARAVEAYTAEGHDQALLPATASESDTLELMADFSAEVDRLQEFVLLNYITVGKIYKQHTKQAKNDAKLQAFLPKLEGSVLFATPGLFDLLCRGEALVAGDRNVAEARVKGGDAWLESRLVHSQLMTWQERIQTEVGFPPLPFTIFNPTPMDAEGEGAGGDGGAIATGEEEGGDRMEVGSPSTRSARRKGSTVAEELLQTRMSNKSLLASASSGAKEAERLKRFKMSGKAFGGSLKRLESGAIVHPHSESYDAAWIDWMENKEKKAYVPKVWKVALTGGPCAGKTSSLSEISNFFRSRGWNVFTSREAATVLLGGGVDFTKCNSEQVFEVQNRILKIMCTVEDSYVAICEAANPGEKCLVVCDRGIMDASVYCDKPTWDRCLAFNGLTHDSSDSRYDGVIHLVTAADGAEDFYNLESNAEGVRTESAEAARELDMKTRAVWEGHPSLNIIDNSTDFPSKVKRVVAAVCGIVGEVPPSKHLKRRKFLARNFNLRGSGLNVQTVNCEYAYLISSDGKQHRLRRRIADGSILYTHIRRSVDQGGHVMDIKNNITRREYLELLCHQDPNRMLIRLVRQTFAFSNRQFACNTIVGIPPQNLSHLSTISEHKGEGESNLKDLNQLLILTVQTDDEDELVMPPSTVVKVEKEVTGLEEYSMYHLSKRGAKGATDPTAYNADAEVGRRLKSG